MLLFNPIERPELCYPLSSYLDPDSNFATRPPSSKYVVREELGEESDTVNNTASFSIMHLNAGSLFGNLDKMNLLLNNVHKHSSVIALLEICNFLVLSKPLTVYPEINYLISSEQKV